MHREEEHLGIPHRLELTKLLRQHPPLAFGQGVHARRCEADVATEQLTLAALVQGAAGEVYDLDVVLAAAERGDDLGGACECDGALRRGATGEHRDSHQRMPASWCSRS